MAEEVAVAAEGQRKASKSPSKAKKAKSAASHPKISVMVAAAITDLKERGGSSLQAIKKYIASSYKVDIERLSPFIKKYLKTAVATGELVQTKGKGASGSFKLKVSSVKGEGSAKGIKIAKKPASPAKKTAKIVKKTPAKKVIKKPKAEKKSKPAKPPRKPKAKAAAKSKSRPKKAKAATKKPAGKKAKK